MEATADLPVLMDLTIDNITENVHRINSQTPNPRLKYVLERLVTHLHDFARETRLNSDEWIKGIQFLTDVGQICTEVRQEFILLSDVLGLSLLVDGIDHPKPPNSTEGTVLGPFHTDHAPTIEQGEGISLDPDGEPCLVLCTVKDTAGVPVEDVKIDIWETDSKGFYDVQYPQRQGVDGRCVIRSDKDGFFWFKAIVPVPYPIPHDGPVGKLLELLRRHPYRPSHMHFVFEKQGYDHLITSLFVKHSPYETTDAVFGVKDSLIVELGRVDATQARRYNVKQGTKLMSYNFILVSEMEANELRETNAIDAMKSLGRKMKLWERLPVPDVD
ncbi:cathecol 1,2-dioxygenase [Ilyonectria destructans]|nr:cathecol 1,2-dioxygenase [Ilyonectria destructans]